MPMAISPERPRSGVTRLTGGRLVKGNALVEEDLWISSVTGKILDSQEVFYTHHVVPDEVIDLRGKVLCPGFLDVQLNGAFGFDFSTVPADMAAYHKGLRALNRQLVRTGVTSYLPTLPSQRPEVYHKALPYLAPSGHPRNPLDGAESLGAHCEGPFISPTKNGIHSPDVLQSAPRGLADFEACYGAAHLPAPGRGPRSPISLITAAPEVAGVQAAIPELTQRGVRVAIGHTEADFEQATAALRAGARMITHLFNAMRPLHHRDPGVFGVLGQQSATTTTPGAEKAEEEEEGEGQDIGRPYFGIIADGIHLHPTTVTIAWHAHPTGFILVTDAMKTVGLPDGVYDWTNGDRWEKKGALLTRAGTDRIAGSSATLGACARNFWRWSGASLAEVVGAVTATPAAMLGLRGVKGTLAPGADADLVVLDAGEGEGGEKRFEVEMVWKFGGLVFDRAAEGEGMGM